ncbi:ATP-binding cassette domain-containing protein [Streptomyces sp. NPDC006193]|uniref:ATP-binding cassette domain-containing protein n=1 Tax=Streptomyces sp. NPDC006193 TaxID=3155717 RepID=UPI0033BCEB08
MIQAFGLTSNSRKAHPPAVDDVSFEARAGHVTALLGGTGAGKTTALRLMLELEQGRGITYFRGRPLHRIAHPSREVGVLLGDVPGHPARSVRNHLRMLCAASGVPARRADEVLEVVGLVSLREERLGTLSRGMDRRLGLACALLPDPHTLVLDEPTDGLSSREAQWLHGMLRAHATQGGTVLLTTADPKEAARTADRVVTLDSGRLVADQPAKEFARTRLRPRVAVRSPHAARLATLLAKEARTARRSVEVVREGGNRLSVYGSSTADVGEIAYRHGILVHQLADEVGDMGPGAGTGRDEATQPPESRRVEPDASPVERAATEQAVPQAEREQPDGDGAYAGGGGRLKSRRPASRSASAALGGSPADPEEAGGEPPTAPGHAVQPETAAPGFAPAGSTAAGPASDPRTPAFDLTTADSRATAWAPGAGAPGPAAAGSRPAAPDDASPAPGATASGHPSGRTESVTGAPSAAAAEPGTGPDAAGEPQAAAVLPTAERMQAAGDERPAPGQVTGGRPDRTGAATLPGAPAPTTSRAAAAAPPAAQPSAASADGPAHGDTAPDGVSASRRGEVPVDASGGRPADGTTAPDPGRGGLATASGAQTSGTSTLTETTTGTKGTKGAEGAESTQGPTGIRTRLPGARHPTTAQPQAARTARPDGVRVPTPLSPLPPPISVRPAPSPLRPLRYELRRAAGIGTGFVTCGAALVVSALTALLLARHGHTPQARLFAAWPRELPLPPTALAAGLIGALAFGDEFRHPALAADRGTVPRRLGLLAAKLFVSGATAALLAFLTVGCDAEALYIAYGRELTEVPADWLSLTAGWFGLVVGCAWAGVLAAGVFRSTSAGLAAVLAVPVLVVPVVRKALQGPAVRMAADFPVRMREVHLLQWPFGGERYVLAAVRVVAQPVGEALALSLTALLCAYLCTALRTRFR